MMGRLTRVTAALTIVAGAALLPASAAFAHGSAVTSSTPEADTVVQALPDVVAIEFAEDLVPVPAALSVLDPQGAQMVSGKATADGSTLSASLRLPADPVPGVYSVTYQVVFTDGASARSKFAFTLDGPAGEPRDTSSASAGSVEPRPDVTVSVDPRDVELLDVEPTSPGSALPAAESQPQEQEVSASAETENSGADPVVVVGALAGAVFLVAGVVVFLRSRSRTE